MRELYPTEDPDKLIALVSARLAHLPDANPEFIRGWCMAATRNLYHKMNSVADYAGALAAVKLLDKLNDKSKPKPIEIDL